MTAEHNSDGMPSTGETGDGFPAERLMSLRPRVPRWRLPVILFGLSCLSIFFVGVCRWFPADALDMLATAGSVGTDPADQFGLRLRIAVLAYGGDALIYTACLLAILFTHEMGHFLMSMRYRIPASFPFFLPLPISPIGTLGAVIAMDGRRADRREIFDIGLAGPIAGLFIAFPILWYGVSQLHLAEPAGGAFALDMPLALRWMIKQQGLQLVGKVPGLGQNHLNPYLMAGWVGLLVTGLNMLPVSQLDGGHVIHGLFGRWSRYIANAFMLIAIIYIVTTESYTWVVMMILLVLMGPTHPPTRDDNVSLGIARTVLGVLSLSIPILCFPLKVFLEL
jgi:membrane-associated protease RseP (regulator of RpoE activity)